MDNIANSEVTALNGLLKSPSTAICLSAIQHKELSDESGSMKDISY